MEFFGNDKLLSSIQEHWLLILILTLLVALYYHYTSTFDFFEKKGVKYMKPTIIVGNLGPRLRGKKSLHEYQLEIYDYFKGHKLGGMFEGRLPMLYLFDPDIIKAVAIRDFDHFVDRPSVEMKRPKSTERILLDLKGSEWKSVRSIMTPAFSSAKLKQMLPLVDTCSKQMVQFLDKFGGKEIEMKSIMGHFTLEVIGACAFGIKGDALEDENAHFIKSAGKFGDLPTYIRIFLMSSMLLVPKLLKFVQVPTLNPQTLHDLMKILRAAKNERRSSGKKQNDFLQLLIDASEQEVKESNTKYMDDDTIDAQSLLFLIAGFETSSTLLSFALYVLATHPELQTKLRDHITEHTDGKDVTFDLLNQMPYLEAFLNETLRRYPPASRVDRLCTKDYVLPGTSVKVRKGDVVSIPIFGIHMDPQYYPEPEVFRPERFMGEEKKERPSHLFLAFGAGPRNCIGLRFAMYSAKMAMIQLLTNFKILPCEKTQIPIKFDMKADLILPEKGVWLRMEKLKQ